MTDTNTDTSAAQRLAEAAAAELYRHDRASQGLGITIERIVPGGAVTKMIVRNDMLNGHGICHGGLIFTLADTAFAMACNSYNQNTVAQKCAIDFVAAARLGDTLSAHAQERVMKGRTGVYDITVHNQNDDIIALFRGNAYRVKGAVLDQSD